MQNWKRPEYLENVTTPFILSVNVSQPPSTATQLREWHETNISKQRGFGVDMGDWEGADFTISPVETSSSSSFTSTCTSTLSSSLYTSVSSSSESPSSYPSVKPFKVLIDVCPARKAYNTRCLPRVNYSVEGCTIDKFKTQNIDDWYIPRKPRNRMVILAIAKLMSKFLPNMPKLSELLDHLEECNLEQAFPMKNLFGY